MANFLYFLVSPGICFLWVWYTVQWVFNSDELIVKHFYLFIIPAALGVFGVASNPWMHWIYYYNSRNQYVRGPLYLWNFALYCVYGVIACFICLRRAIHDKKKEERRRDLLIVLFMLPPIIGNVIQNYFYGLDLVLPCIALSLLELYFIMQAQKERHREVEMERLKYEEIQKSTDLMKSQLQPHFLFNALNTICYLCDADPPAAGRAVLDFASVLRTNMDSITSKAAVPFAEELRNVQSYMAIEKYRFPMIQIEYQAVYADFKLPLLTLQPLVHNAIRHGLYPKQGGGTIVLRSFCRDNLAYVTISDDGVGFEPACVPALSSQSGIGMVRSRLAYLCNGRLEIQSKPGCGTTVTIIVPNMQH